MGWHRLAHHRGPRSEWSPIQPGRGDDRRRGQLLGGGILSQYGRQRLLRPDADRALSVGRTTAARGTERNGQGDGSAWVLQLLWLGRAVDIVGLSHPPTRDDRPNTLFDQWPSGSCNDKGRGEIGLRPRRAAFD